MENIVYNLLNWQSADLTIWACAGIIYQLFSLVSPLPRILHTTQKLPFITAHLNTYSQSTANWTVQTRPGHGKSNVNLISIKYLCI